MKLELIEYVSSTCGLVFEAPGLSENAYGEFLLRSKHGSISYLNVFQDSTYKEVDILLVQELSSKALAPIDRAKILRRIYGQLACDRDNGMTFEIDAFPICPRCGDNLVSSWRFKNPPVFVDVNVAPVTHQEWDRLSEVEKITRLRAHIAED